MVPASTHGLDTVALSNNSDVDYVYVRTTG